MVAVAANLPPLLLARSLPFQPPSTRLFGLRTILSSRRRQCPSSNHLLRPSHSASLLLSASLPSARAPSLVPPWASLPPTSTVPIALFLHRATSNARLHILTTWLAAATASPTQSSTPTSPQITPVISTAPASAPAPAPTPASTTAATVPVLGLCPARRPSPLPP
ncbi:hypothetical protein F5883DRAFT_561923 [Diaporthe sp. PMI_573]|nr:hypothetical protein F5883DRAFT_561923 [Diaporthaceae sp. PMI_573]